MVFPLVIQTGTRTSSKHLFISSASLSWMEVNFLNQNPCIQSEPGVFPCDIYFLVSFWVVSKCIFPFRAFSWVFLVLCAILFIHSAVFVMLFLVAIVLSIQKRSRSLWRLVVGMFSCNAHPVVVRIFFRSCFGMSCFVHIVLPFGDISLISLLSTELSSLFPQVVLLFFTCCLFHSVPKYSRIFLFYHFDPLSLIFYLCFPILVLTVSSC